MLAHLQCKAMTTATDVVSRARTSSSSSSVVCSHAMIATIASQAAVYT
jgi:hypothetical protein